MTALQFGKSVQDGHRHEVKLVFGLFKIFTLYGNLKGYVTLSCNFMVCECQKIVAAAPTQPRQRRADHVCNERGYFFVSSVMN